MRQSVPVVLASALLAGLVGMATADPTFVEGRLNLRVEAQVNPDQVQWQLVSRDLTGDYKDISVATSINADTANGTVVTFSSADASWDSAGQGSVHFGDTGYIQAVFSQGGNSDVDSSGWFYTFTTGDEDTFLLNYVVASSADSTDTSSLGGFDFVIVQGDEVVSYQNLELDSGDVIAVPLDPNQTYTAMLLPVVELNGGLGLGLAAMTADFDWSITSGNPLRKHPNLSPQLGVGTTGSAQPAVGVAGSLQTK